MYHIVNSDSLAESEKVELFTYYTLSNIEFWHHCLGYTEQNRLQ
jgi:hypothetical protein